MSGEITDENPLPPVRRKRRKENIPVTAVYRGNEIAQKPVIEMPARAHARDDVFHQLPFVEQRTILLFQLDLCLAQSQMGMDSRLDDGRVDRKNDCILRGLMRKPQIAL